MPERNAPGVPGPRGRERLRAIRRLRALDLGIYTTLFERWGNLVSLGLPGSPVFLFHPEHAKRVLWDEGAHFAKGATLRPFRELLGNGLLLSEGAFWRRQRRLVAPEFKPARVAGFAPAIARHAEALLASWETDAARGTPREVARDMLRLSFGVSGDLLLSEDLRGDLGTVERLTSQGARITMRRFFAPIKLPYWLPTPDNLRRRGLNRTVDRLVYGILDRRAAAAHGEDAGAADRPADLVTRLLAARDEQTGEPMSRRQVRDEVVTLLMASFDTTGMALAWSLYLLAMHPEVQEELAAEAAAATAATAEDPAGEHEGGHESSATRLPCTRRVLLEALRLYPPIVGLLRVAGRATALGGHELPAGQSVMVSTYQVHRHPEFWPEPAAFRPARFERQSIEAQHPYAYLPFGRGMRSCVGEHLALLEATLVLSRIAGRFRFRLAAGAPPVVPLHLVTLRPENGIHLRIEPRFP